MNLLSGKKYEPDPPDPGNCWNCGSFVSVMHGYYRCEVCSVEERNPPTALSARAAGQNWNNSFLEYIDHSKQHVSCP